jgi:DNA-binding transcriptional ArsR family regulator
MNVSRESATVWAEWFRCLGEPTRVLILNLLATAGRPMTVGEIVDRLDVGQSTVSHHLKVLAATCFVLVEHEGTASYFRINERCLDRFPSAAELVMGRLPRRSGGRNLSVPWEPPARKPRPRAARKEKR